MSDQTPQQPESLPPDWKVKAIERLNRLVPNAGNCLACGSLGVGKVVAGEHLVTPIMTDPQGGLTIGGTTYPQISLICTNCGFTRYFNYLVLANGDKAAENAAE